MFPEIWTLTFGQSVGGFTLGMSINDLIALISRINPPTNMEIVYPKPEEVLTHEICIVVVDIGIRFRFQAVSQRLYLIDIYDLTRCTVSINGSCFGRMSGSLCTIDILHKVLGASFPGKFISNSVYFLRFDGVAFFFSVPALCYTKVMNKDNLLSSLCYEESVTLNRIMIHSFALNLESPSSLSDSIPVSVRMRLQKLNNEDKDHLQVLIYVSPSSSSHECLTLGMYSQDVISLLGNPDVVAATTTATSSYNRYEYHHLGLELYLCQTSHALVRIIVHNNLPGLATFGRFARCAFQIDFNDCISNEMITSITTSATTSTAVSHGNSVTDKTTVTTLSTSIPAIITCSTPWEEARISIRHWLRGTEETLSAVKAQPPGSPFPATRLFGFPEVNLVFEVSEGGYIASIVLLESLAEDLVH